MSHIHLNLGNDLLRAEVRAHVACLANQLPNAEFNIVVTGAALAAILGNTGDLMVNTPAAPAGKVFPADIHDSASPVRPAAASAAAAADKPAAADKTERFRRTNEETAAGLTVDQAKAYRAQTTISDPVAYAASLAPAAAPTDAVQHTTPAASPPPPAPEAPAAAETPPVATEQDVRDAAAAAVKGGKKADVLKIAQDYGVANWKELDPSKYGEALTKLTALLVVG